MCLPGRCLAIRHNICTQRNKESQATKGVWDLNGERLMCQPHGQLRSQESFNKEILNQSIAEHVTLTIYWTIMVLTVTQAMSDLIFQRKMLI
jgi:hypothetical protein